MKKQTTFPQWKGFECSPQGCLLEQVIDLNGDMGFAYERCCEYYKDFHVHDRLMLIFPRGTSSMEVRTAKPRELHRVDSASVLLVPKGLDHDDEGTAAIYDTIALYPTGKLLNTIAKKLEIPLNKIEQLHKHCVKMKRHKKLDQYVQEYFFERVLSKRPADDEDSLFLARRILEETLRAIFPSATKGATDVPPKQATESVAVNALRYIETNLFEELDLKEIAKKSAASVSTLLRRFREEMDLTPHAYIKSRRLEEAHRLLSAGERTVGEVAILVGYGNFGAFSEAFKSQFGILPSSLLKKASSRT